MAIGSGVQSEEAGPGPGSAEAGGGVGASERGSEVREAHSWKARKKTVGRARAGAETARAQERSGRGRGGGVTPDGGRVRDRKRGVTLVDVVDTG